MKQCVGVAVALAGYVVAFAASPATGGLTPQERRGKHIYLRGLNTVGKEITAFLGNPPMEVPGATMTCAQCHGYDGRGNPEGGVSPSDVTWQLLTKPYGVSHASGRKHPPYTEALLARAITDGVDPAGHKLNLATMPSYGMSPEDLSDLVAYMKRLGTELDPGLTADTITLGTLVPPKGRLAEMGEAMRAVLAAYFEDLNEQGGIYSRRIKLRVAESGQTPAETRQKLGRFVEEEGIFAMVGAFIAGADSEITSLAADKEVPMVGPSTLHPLIADPPNRHVFYLFSGTTEESRALVKFAAQTLKATGAPAAVLYPEDAEATEIAGAVESQGRQSGWDRVAKVRYTPGRFDAGSLVKQLTGDGTKVVFFLGSGREAAALAEEAGKSGWKPDILAPASMPGKQIFEVPPDFQGKIYLSLPLIRLDQTPAAVMQFRTFAARHRIVGGHPAAMISAYTAAKVLVHGLKLAGRGVSREKLIAALEGIYKFDTGLTPPISYGPNRRIGALGAHVVEVLLDKKEFAPAGGWVEVQ